MNDHSHNLKKNGGGEQEKAGDQKNGVLLTLNLDWQDTRQVCKVA